VTATANSAITSLTNPAGMSRFHTKETIVQLAVVYGKSESTGEIPDLGISRSGSDSGSIGIPSFYHTRPLSDKWDFGLSINAPAGFGDDYGAEDFRRYFATEWSLVYIAVNPALSYRVSDRFSIGGAVAMNYTRYKMESKVLNVDSPGTNDGDAELEADDFSVSFIAGMMYEFSEQTRVGFMYRAGTDSELKAVPKFSNLSANTQALIEATGRADREISIESELPPIAVIGLFHEFDGGVELSVDLAHIGWSDFALTEFAFAGDNLIERRTDYDDALAVSIGFSIPYKPSVTLGAAAAYLESPVTDLERSFLFRIDDSWIVGFGAEFERPNDRSITVNLNYGQSADGRISTGALPRLGEITSAYDSRWFVVLDFKYKWR
jgi:long-chain fatty acid transport protein